MQWFLVVAVFWPLLLAGTVWFTWRWGGHIDRITRPPDDLTDNLTYREPRRSWTQRTSKWWWR